MFAPYRNYLALSARHVLPTAVLISRGVHTRHPFSSKKAHVPVNNKPKESFKEAGDIVKEITAGRYWGWGATELNRPSFVDVAAYCDSHQNDNLPIHEYGHDSPAWHVSDVENVHVTHREPHGIIDHIAFRAVKIARWNFDTFSGYRFGKLTKGKLLFRVLFLETIAGVPGMVGGMWRHMSTLRTMKQDHGWIQTLLDEAENERMHLLTFMEIHKPGLIFRLAILIAQGIMFNFLVVSYILCPRFVHRFVGYLEEEAVLTYTSILQHLEKDEVPGATALPVPKIAHDYWHLPATATFRDLIAMIRADESEHRLVNHTFADMHAEHLHHGPNPFQIMKLRPDNAPRPPAGTK